MLAIQSGPTLISVVGYILAAVAAIVGSLATLFGVLITQRNSRELKEMELKHNEEMKQTEFVQERAKRILDERYDLYHQIFKHARSLLEFWRPVAEAGKKVLHEEPVGPVDESYLRDLVKSFEFEPEHLLSEAKDKKREQKIEDIEVETELIGARSVFTSLQSFYQAIEECRQGYIKRAPFYEKSAVDDKPRLYDALLAVHLKFKEAEEAYESLRKVMQDDIGSTTII